MVTFKVTTNTGELAESLDEQIQIGVEGYVATKADEVLSTAKTIAPVATGRLRAGLAVTDLDPMGFTVASRTRSALGRPYGLFVEIGTGSMRAQPYLRPSLLRAGFTVRALR